MRTGSGERAGAGSGERAGAGAGGAADLSAAGRFAALAHEVALPIALASEAAGQIMDGAARLAEIVERATGADPALREEARTLAARLARDADAIARGLVRAERLMTSSQRSLGREAHASPGGRTRLGPCVRDALATVEPYLRKRNLRAELSEADPSLEVRADAAAVVEVVLNLVINAARHAYPAAAAGRIEVALARADGSPPAIRLAVRDFGRGIPADALARVFEPGFTTATLDGGSGLGLSIVKEIVEGRLAGTIRCESAPGRGTLFEVLLPPA